MATNKEIDTDPAQVDWAWLRLNDVDLMLNHRARRAGAAAVRDSKRVFGHGVCFYVGCPDVDAATSTFAREASM